MATMNLCCLHNGKNKDFVERSDSIQYKSFNLNQKHLCSSVGLEKIISSHPRQKNIGICAVF